MTNVRNPHVGQPFTDDDDVIAVALEEVSASVLLCSLVHMTGDPSWIRDVSLRSMPTSADVHGGLSDEELDRDPAPARCRPSPPTGTAGAYPTTCPETSSSR